MKRILLVDDDEAHNELLSLSLEQHDVELQTALDGITGLEKANAWQPHLILLDIHMPKLDGHGTLKRLKQDERTRRIPVVMFTTSFEQDHVAQAYGDQCAAYVVKPRNLAEFDELAERLHGFWAKDVTYAEP